MAPVSGSGRGRQRAQRSGKTDAAGMAKQARRSRSRCTVCRGWYQPHGCAQAKQKTCSEECRRKRQRQLARKRRAADVQEHRVAERERQRRSRAKRRQADAGVQPAETALERCEAEARSRSVTAGGASLSRAGLGLQDMEMVEELLNWWDREQTLSRARLEQELLGMTGHLRPKWRHGRQKGPPVTRQARAARHGNDIGKQVNVETGCHAAGSTSDTRMGKVGAR